MVWHSTLKANEELVINGVTIIRNANCSNIRLEILEVEGTERVPIQKRKQPEKGEQSVK